MDNAHVRFLRQCNSQRNSFESSPVILKSFTSLFRVAQLEVRFSDVYATTFLAVHTSSDVHDTRRFRQFFANARGDHDYISNMQSLKEWVYSRFQITPSAPGVECVNYAKARTMSEKALFREKKKILTKRLKAVARVAQADAVGAENALGVWVQTMVVVRSTRKGAVSISEWKIFVAVNVAVAALKVEESACRFSTCLKVSEFQQVTVRRGLTAAAPTRAIEHKARMVLKNMLIRHW